VHGPSDLLSLPDLDDAQRRVLEHERGPLLVTGPAGTGKTTALRARFVRLLEDGADPERTALVVGTRRARAEARTALLAALSRPLPDLKVLTVHALAFDVVGRRFEPLGYDAPPTVLSANEQFARIRELLAGEDPAEWPAYGSMLRLRGFADEVRQLVLRAQESLLRPEDLEAGARDRGMTGWLEVAAFYRRYLEVLDGQREVDFAGVVEQASVSADRGEPLFDHLLVDDFQDATLGTERLLEALRPDSLVVAGNLDAHVFSFQGFTDVPLRRFAQRFAGARTVELAAPHRSRSVSFTAWSAAHSSEEHAAAARELRRIHLEEDVPWDRLAVVVRRQGRHLGGLLRALDDAGIPRVVPDTPRSLLVEPATAPYVLALRWLARPKDRDGLVEALLASDLVRCSPAEARAMVRAALAAGEPAAAAVAQDDELPEARRPVVAQLRDALAAAEALADRSVLDAFRVLWRDLPSSRRLVARAEGGSLDAQRDLDAVLSLSRAVARFGERPDASTAAFLEWLEAGEEGPGAASEDDRHRGAVRVLTAHGTAGREFDTVLVVGAVEGNFPSLSRPEPMFDLATLAGPVSQSERNRGRLEDERRLFDLVVGRARRRVVFTASDEHGPDATVTARSRFVARAGVAWEPAPLGPFAHPLTVAEATAAWRRSLADPASPPAHRLAALDGLLALGVDPSTWWFQRDWTDPGGPLRDHVRVSASRLETLDNCELQFVLGEELGLDTTTSYHAWVGHTVHRLIEDVERGRLERSLEALVAAAEERWALGSFPSRAVSETWRRLVVDRMLPAWWKEYGQAPADEVEKRFEFPFDGATVAGVIDRIGRVQPSGSQITDYKTGKRRERDPDESLQLRVYFLALHEAEELRTYLPVRAVELAFVRDTEWHQGGIARTARGFTGDDEAEYEADSRAILSEMIGRVRSLYETARIRPNPAANCRFCSFQPLCPLFPEGAEIFPAPRRQPQGARA
jgi:superfamily I DNA/RNA helicase/RecB family exonuclease